MTKNCDIVARQSRILRDKHKLFELGLRDQHPVERIGVMARQPAGGEGVRNTDRQRFNSRARQQVIKLVERKAQAPERILDRDLPYRRGADTEFVGRIDDRRFRGNAQPARF